MRKHHINCKIEGKTRESLVNVRHIINKFYIRKIKKTLNESNLTLQEKRAILERLLRLVKEKYSL